jgi:RimJ/RimL family protein N-acetyltransferase/catechol 2,3-dioxygenase-like lactoylglutathione lyase family enzyme
MPRPPDELHTERLRLRPPVPGDADAIFAHYATDPQVTRFLPWAPHADVAVTRAFLDTLLAARARGERWPWVLERRADGRLLGMIELRREGARAHFGYVLERASWGQGLMSEAVRAVVEWCQSQPEIERVSALVYPDNDASARVLERCGLRCEGHHARGAPHGATLVDVLNYAWARRSPPPDAPLVLELDHVQLPMPPGGLPAARAFWCGILGLREVPRPPDLTREGAWFVRGVVRIHVGAEEGFTPPRRAHPALRVAGFDALLARLRAAGHELRMAETLDGLRRAHVADPFGNVVELGEA